MTVICCTWIYRSFLRIVLKGHPLWPTEMCGQIWNSSAPNMRSIDGAVKWGTDRLWVTFRRLNYCCDEPMFLYHRHSVLLQRMPARYWSMIMCHVWVISVVHFRSAHPPSVRPSFDDSNLYQPVERSFILTSWLIDIFLSSSCKIDLAVQSHRLKPYSDKNFNFSFQVGWKPP